MRSATIYQDQAGEWRYTIRSANHEAVGQSEGYTRRWSAVRAAKSDRSITEIRVLTRTGDLWRTIRR